MHLARRRVHGSAADGRLSHPSTRPHRTPTIPSLDGSLPPSREPLFTGAFLRLWTFVFVTFLSAFQLFPAIPFRIVALGGSKAEGGLFLAAYTFACAVSAPLTGVLADAFGRKRVLVAGGAGFLVFSLLYGVVTHLPLLLAVACVHGVFWSGILSSSGAMISEVIPESRRTEGLSYWGMAGTAAVAVAPAVGLSVYRLGWLTLCLEMAGLSVFMVFFALRVPAGSHETRRPAPGELVDWRVMAAATCLTAVSFGYGGVTSYVAMLATDRKIQPASLFFTVFAITILALRFLTGPVGDRFGAKALLYPSLGVLPFGLALIAVARTPAAIVVASVLYGIGFAGAYPAFMTWLLERTAPERRAATFGSVLWAFDAGISAGSLVIGQIVQRVGYTAAFLTGAVAGTASIPLFLLAQRLVPAPPGRDDSGGS